MKRPALIVFFGMDGSGKTTQAKLLEDHLTAKGLKVDYRWSRREAFLTKIPARLVKKFVLREKGSSDGARYVEIKKKRSKMAKNPLVRWAWINATLADYLALLHVRVFRPARGADVLICDRYLQDSIADFAAMLPDPVAAARAIAGSPLARLFPKPRRLYFIDISPEVAKERKDDDTNFHLLQDRVALYRELAAVAGALVVDGNGKIEEVAEVIRGDADQMETG